MGGAEWRGKEGCEFGGDVEDFMVTAAREREVRIGELPQE